MNIHEYQAKELLELYGIPTPGGKAALSIGDATEAAQEISGPVWVVKAQIHAGGRGKGTFKEAEAGEKGGVRFAKSKDDVRVMAEEMLGRTLVTKQTGPEGRVVNRLLITESCDIDRELYLSALVDRSSSRVAFIASQAGGMNIEEVAEETPEKITTVTIDPATGFMPYHGRKIAFALGLEEKVQMSACLKLVAALYKMVLEKDVSLLEINPLVVTKTGELTCLDAKVSFDSNALYRHPDIVEMRDFEEEDPAEVEASKHDLSYVKLDARSAAWSTVPVSPWRQWTSSSSLGPSRRTSSTSAAGRPRRRCRPLSRSFFPIRP